MHKKIEGIIVNEYSFEETSKIINILTSNGLIGVKERKGIIYS